MQLILDVLHVMHMIADYSDGSSNACTVIYS